ncbi:Transposase, partial [Caligus rogercresseyi]
TPDFRSYFLIRIKLARTVNEIHGDLLSTFPDSCSGLSTLQRWHTESDKGAISLEKKTRPGRPRETRTEENVTRVKCLVEDNPRLTTRQVAAEVSLSSTTVFRLLTEDLGLQNLLSVLVPHHLSEAYKTQRVKCCQDLLKLFQDHGEDFLGSHLLVQDDSWFYWDSADPVCETDSKEDDNSDGVHLQAEAADRNTMIEYLRTTGKRFLSLKKDKIRLKDCLLMWDNARPHTATDTREFLTRKDVEPVKQSPYSPDLNLCDGFCSGKLKHLLREDEFGAHEEATLAVQRAMRRVSEDELYD